MSTLSLHRTLPRLLRDPVNALAAFAREAGGDVVRLNLGPFQPYLVTHPEHVQQVLRSGWENYQREGMFWKPVERLAGRSVISEGPGWESSRKILQPLFTTRYVKSLSQGMAETINEGVGALEPYARAGRPIDVNEEMGRIIARMVIRVLFGSKISLADAERLAPAYVTAATSFSFRLLMPFVPYSVPLPGDRAFARAVKTVDEVVLPLVRQVLRDPGDGDDIISAIARARLAHGSSAEQQIRDDLVSVYGAAVETTAVALTWLWPVLDAHPQVAARLYEEVDEVVGEGPVDPERLPELRYMKMVLQELLRLYPPGWILPRMAMEPGTLDGVPMKAGAQVLISPFATHRLPEFWERPLEFDPERFAPDGQERQAQERQSQDHRTQERQSPQRQAQERQSPERRHRYAYFPFGGGPHVCLGQHLFYVEAPLLLGALLSRFRPALVGTGPFTPFPAASLRPKERVEVRLVGRGAAA